MVEIHLLRNVPQAIVVRAHWWLVNIGSGNDLPSGTKPLTESALTKISDAICNDLVTLFKQ